MQASQPRHPKETKGQDYDVTTEAPASAAGRKVAAELRETVMTIALPITNDVDLFGQRLLANRQTWCAGQIATLQLNIGKMCNLACHHCHVEAGPKRTEIMTWETMQQILGWLDAHGAATGIKIIDVTGGARK